jgi:hypothetical protein
MATTMANSLRTLAVVLCALVMARTSRANVVDFSFSGPGQSGSGQIFLGSPYDGGFTVTAATGTFDGHAITGITPLNTDRYYIYNNLLFYSDFHPIDLAGILFEVAGLGNANLYYDKNFDGGSYAEADDAHYSENKLTSFAATSAIPEPATLGLVASAILGAAVALRRKMKV